MDTVGKRKQQKTTQTQGSADRGGFTVVETISFEDGDWGGSEAVATPTVAVTKQQQQQQQQQQHDIANATKQPN